MIIFCNGQPADVPVGQIEQKRINGITETISRRRQAGIVRVAHIPFAHFHLFWPVSGLAS